MSNDEIEYMECMEPEKYGKLLKWKDYHSKYNNKLINFNNTISIYPEHMDILC